jgi:hypothetical protein
MLPQATGQVVGISLEGASRSDSGLDGVLRLDLGNLHVLVAPDLQV